MKPFLILQLRPEDQAAEEEFGNILRAGSLKPEDVQRVRMEQQGIPEIRLDNFSGVIVGGGPSCVSSKNKKAYEKRFEKQLHGLLREIVARDFPYLGACYGLGILVDHLGGKMEMDKYTEGVGAATIELTEAASDDPILNDLPQKFRAIGGHKESCTTLPKEAILLAKTDKCPVHMMRYKNNIYATQFHPELDSKGTATRIRVYKNYGYFKPEEADQLIADVMKETLNVPEKISERFVKRYQQVI